MAEALLHPQCTEAKPGETHVQPALSRDGKLLAFIVDRDGISAIRFVKLKEGMIPDGEAQELRFSQLGNTICRDPVWRANKELLFITQKGALSWLWSVRVDATGRATSPRLIGSLGEEARMLAVPQSGKQLVFSRHMANENLNVLDLSQGASGESQTIYFSARRSLRYG